MKFRIFLVMMLLFSLVVAGCGQEKPATNDNQANQEQPNQEGTKEPEKTGESESATETSDVVTTASIVNDGEALAYALGVNGRFITAILQDLTLEKDLVVVGNTNNKDDATQPLYRKIALYTQDEDHKIIDSFTLTVPKMIVKSENFKIQGGTLKGDVYVEANGFTIHETATVDGNIYFANEEYKTSAVIDGKVTGKTEIGAKPDAVTTASIVNDGEALAYALGENGRFITAILEDMTLDKDLVVVGNTNNKDDTTQPLYRKVALYTQNEEHQITESFTLTVPKLIVKSENFKIQGGTLKGDVYVEANGFTVDKTATVDGNIYFANEEYKTSAVIDGTVTGALEVK